VPGNGQGFARRAAGEQTSDLSGHLLHEFLVLLLAAHGVALTAPGAHLFVGEALLLRFIERRLLDQDSLPLITLARATELDDDNGE
jgi:hypothetical protein